LRQVKALALMIALILLLASCKVAGKAADEMALDIRTALLEAEKLEITTNVTADYGDRVYDFKLKFTGNADLGEIEILAPESIAGLKAEVSISGGTLKYDGATLDTGALTGDGLSPAEAVPVLIAQWQTGFLSGCNFEKLDETDALAVTSDVTESVAQRTWFDTETRLPLRAELSENGEMVIKCDFENVIIE
jgi:outer membrane lipoprotein-sorting protein